MTAIAAMTAKPRATDGGDTAAVRRRAAVALTVTLAVAVAFTAAAPGLVPVRRGDTLSSIARKHHTTVAALRALNGLPNDTIYAGTTLKVPGREPAPAPGATAPAGPAPATLAAAHRATLANRPLPDRATVQALIRRQATALGVDPALALAVAHQESGFSPRVVSAADAVGAMQVLPSTARWLSDAGAGRDLDVLEPEDNALAGVLLLRRLLAAAPVDQAIGGYYQGLRSVQSRGMLPSTKAYVANVLALRARYA